MLDFVVRTAACVAVAASAEAEEVVVVVHEDRAA